MSKIQNSRQRRRRFRLLRKLAVPFAILAIVGGVLALTPFSSRTLDRQIQATWFRATGMEISFRRAVYRLGWGKLDLSDVRIDDPAEDRHLTDITRMTIGWRWQPLTPANLFGLESVQIVAPTPTRIHIDRSGRLAPDPRLESFLRLIHRLETRSRATSGQSGPSSLRITDFPVYLYREEGGESRLLTGIRPLDLEFRSDPGGSWSLALTGNLAGETSSPILKILVESVARSDLCFFTVVLESFDLADQVQVPLAFRFATGQAVVKGVARLDRGRLVFDRSSIRAESIRLADKEGVASLHPTAVEMSFGATLDLQTRRIEIGQADLRVRDSFVRGSGTLSLAAPYDFAVQVREAELSGALFAWLQQAFPRTLKEPRIEGGRARTSGFVAGDERGIDRSRCWGSLDARDATVRASWLGKPVTLVAVEAEWTTSTLDLERIDLQALDNRLHGSARIAGSEGESTGGLQVEANWTAEIQTAQVKDLLLPGQFPLIDNWSVEGQILGNGSIRGTWRPAAPESRGEKPEAETARNAALESFRRAAQTLQIDGLLRLERLRIDNPRLPAPIENMSGTLVMGNRTLDCGNLEGETLGSRITLSGQIKDKENAPPWSDPDFNLHIQGDLDLTHAPKAVQTPKRTWLRRLRPQGRLGIDLFARGPAMRPAEIALLGDVSASDVSLNLDSPFARGELRNASLVLHLFPDRVVLDRIGGKIGGLDLSTSGTVSQEELNLNLTGTGDLSDGAKILPWLVPPSWHFEGNAQVDTRLAMRLKPEARLLSPGGLLTNFLAVVNSPAEPGAGPAVRLDTDSLDKRFDWGIEGAIVANDCTLWENVMSQKVTHINGRLLFDRRGLRSDGEGTAQWGQCPGVTSMTIAVAPGGYPWVKFDARFPHVIVDEWVEGWGSNLETSQTLREAASSPHAVAKPFTPETAREFTPKFAIETSIRSQTAAFEKLALGETSTHFVYTYYAGHTGHLEMDRLDGKLYNGEIHLNLDLIWQSVAHWTMSLRVNDVVCEKLIAAAFGKESTVTGKLSGEASIRARSDTPREWSAEGTCVVRDSRFLGNPVFAALGRLLKHKALGDISFTTMKGEFSILNRVVRIPNLTFEGTLMDLYATGEAGLDGSLDLIIFYKLFGVLKGIPVLSQLTEVIDQLGKSILKVHAGGTIQEPQLVVVPFSADDFRIMGFKKVDDKTGMEGEGTVVPPSPAKE